MGSGIVKATDQALILAAALIRAGRLVAVPTETVYGLAANALDPSACAAIYALKGRPADNPLIVHVGDLAEADRLARTGPLAERLAGAFWPGPLTLVLERSEAPGTIALRAPSHPVTRRLIALSGRPLAAPSANLSGRPSPTTAQHVDHDLGDALSLILDGGPAPLGLESTVVDLTRMPPMILRLGAISPEALLAYGVESGTGENGRPPAPGTRYRHYTPSIPVVVLVDGPHESAGQALAPWARWFKEKGEMPGCLAVATELPAGLPGRSFASAEEMATGLFAAFRELENRASVILVAAPGPVGIGHAIRDRLQRASDGVFRVAGEPLPEDLLKGD